MEWFKRQNGYQKALIVGVAVIFGLGVIGSFVPDEESARDSSSSEVEPSVTTSSLAPTTTTLPELSWYEALGADVARSDVTAAVCDDYKAVISEKQKVVKSRLSGLKANAEDGYDAAEYFPTIDWELFDHRSDLDSALTGIALRGLQDFEVPYSESRVASFLQDSLLDCGLSESGLFAEVRELDSKLAGLRSKVDNLPWYPKDFKLFDSNIAYRFLSYAKGEYRCSYSGSYCWGVEIVTLSGCNNLYGELTILDSAGRNIGYTNDLTSGVRANERVKLIFDTFENGADQGRLEEVSCY
jgi:hypothetical protein